MQINKTSLVKSSVMPVVSTEVKEKGLEPKDGFVTTGTKSEEPVLTKEMIMGKLGRTEAKEEGRASKIRGGVGVATGLALGTAGLYGGIIGGGVAGGITGLSLGPANAVIQGAQGLAFAGTVLGTGGAVAKAAIVAGTACAVAGGIAVGYHVGGFGKGEESGKASYYKEGTVTKTLQGVGGGIGLITGGLGGAAIGAGIGGGVALTSGIIAKDVAMSSIGMGGLVGAGVGALVLGGMSALGGYAMATVASKGVQWAKNKVFPDKDGVNLEEKKAAVAKKEAEFTGLSGKVQGETKELQDFFATKEKELDGQQKETKEYIDGKEAALSQKKTETQSYIDGQQKTLDEKEKIVSDADKNIEGIINGKADKIFADI
ncbi:MAG: hypothetical protein ABRQ39_06695, partial [Candidatus Eremiobacterota bacterium]